VKHLDYVQGSEPWKMARVGIPTASMIDQILTPKTLKYSDSAAKYRNRILTEWIVGHPIDWSGSGDALWMERGVEMEAEARAYYNFQFDTEVQQVGFLVRDDGKFGGSPDGLVGEDGGVEFKCPSLHVMVGYVIAPETLEATYRGQVQSYLYISGRKWWDLVAYNPELPPVALRILPDEKYVAALESALSRFITDLDEAKRILRAKMDAFAGPEPDVEDGDFPVHATAGADF
jgi:hypothetical protein